MTVLLTGAQGKIGQWVARHLAEAGYRLKGTDRNYARDFPGEWTVADLRQREAIYPLLENVEAIVHLGNVPSALFGDPQSVCLDNTQINFHVFQAALEVGVKKIIFASSIQCLSNGEGRWNAQSTVCLPYLPADENTPPRPGNAYALSKQLAENMLAYAVDRGLPEGIALRLPGIYSPERMADLRESQRKPRTPVNVNELFSYLSVLDFARLVKVLLRTPLPGYRVYFPASYHNNDGRSAETLARGVYPGVPVRQPLDQWGNGLIDNSTLTRETGWKPLD